jgi:Dyp-type peroxidase family
MHKVATSKHLDSVSDLLVRAKIKTGFVETLDSISYASRLTLVAEALFDARASAREFQLVEPFADVTARIQSLESFRIALFGDPPSELVLAATFDRAWEPYIRLIWRPLGTFLDLIFCNCEGYPLASQSDFATYAQWVRASQVESAFFYAASGLTVTDVNYLDRLERLQRQSADSERAILSLRAESPMAAAAQVQAYQKGETLAQAVEGLSVLYRLTDLYPPGTTDGIVLQRAARDLLAGWDPVTLPAPVQYHLREQLAWFREALPPLGGSADPGPAFDPTIVQAGIVSGFGTPAAAPNHGCLLLLSAETQVAARAFLGWIKDRVSVEADPAAMRAPGKVQTSLAVTRPGLQTRGLGEDRIAAFPKEFQEGPDARAGLVGDVRGAHPRRWALPLQNWPPGTHGQPPVELSEIDMVVQLRVRDESAAWDLFDPDRPHPLRRHVDEIAAVAASFGVRLLAVETMRRASDDNVEHFGFVDGISQPRVRLPTDPVSPGTVALGEFVLGFRNERGDVPVANPDLAGGSFLVIRKLKQDVQGLEALLAGLPSDEERDLALAKMMGRARDGTPLADAAGEDPNAFDFGADAAGGRCPLASHIRRTNPRIDEHGVPPPRIMRRGMSYGPPRGSNDPGAQGTFFMAYCASIAEQFEVVQRWINGGNSTGAFSRQVDPIAGTAPANHDYVYRFGEGGQPRRLTIAKPLVTLEWGMYLFVPSLTTIASWAVLPATVSAADPLVERGRAVIARIASLPPGEQALAWTMCIEDFIARDPDERAEAGAVWAAIRATEDGVLRVPFGRDGSTRHAVLVGSPELVGTVLREDRRYSMRDQRTRMAESFGEIFLGLDSGPEYEARSAATVALLSDIEEEEAFKVARQAADGVLAQFIGKPPATPAPVKLDLRRDFLPLALAEICRYWFGVPDGQRIQSGGWSWSDLAAQPRCPGSFVAPSRFCFYPDPNGTVTEKGRLHGRALTRAIQTLFTSAPRESLPDAPITKGLGRAISDPGELARTLVGVMIGFLPPAEANMRFALYGWTKAKTLHRVQRALLASNEPYPFARARAELLVPLKRAIQQRPAPETLWRTAVVDHRIGRTHVRNGDVVIAGLVSATAEAAAGGRDDISAVFGGDRRALDHPVHACPAYQFAIGTMLGILSALLECGRLEILPSPLIMQLTRGPGWQPRAGSDASAFQVT